MSAAAKLDDAQLAAAVDAVFALEADDHGWLRGVVSALIQLSGPEHQCLGFFYDAASDRELQLRNVCVASASLELEPAWLEFTAKEKYRLTFQTQLPVLISFKNRFGGCAEGTVI